MSRASMAKSSSLALDLRAKEDIQDLVRMGKIRTRLL
jgi:hypothetical protein